MTRPPWWTDADRAELALLLWEFIGLARMHKGMDGYRRCPRCEAAIGGWCETLVSIWDDVEAWIVRRRLISRAEFFRRRHIRERLAELHGRTT